MQMIWLEPRARPGSSRLADVAGLGGLSGAVCLRMLLFLLFVVLSVFLPDSLVFSVSISVN